MNIYSALKIPKVLYQIYSPINGNIQVFEIGSTKKLKVGGIDQSLNWDSPLCEKLVWGKMSELFYKLNPNANSLLVLGLGGGTLQHLISKKMPELYITSIEIDKIMVDVAENYFDLNLLTKHKTIIGDALGVVSNPQDYGLNKGTFDSVIVDILLGDKYPDLGKSGNFIECVKSMVIPGGFVIFNRIYIQSHQYEVDLFIDQVSNFFTDVQTEIVPGYTNSDNLLVYGRAFEHKF